MRKICLTSILLFLLLGCTSNSDALEHNASSYNETYNDSSSSENDSILLEGCLYDNPSCGEQYTCIEQECVLKHGCMYDNPICPDDQECINNECFDKYGCKYGNPSCLENYQCVNNTCILEVPEGPYQESCSTCLYNSPGYECVYGNCIKILPSDCDAGLCCNLDSCINKTGCYYGNPKCNETEMCLNNQCIFKPSLLSVENSSDADFFYALHFASDSLSQEQFDYLVEQTAAAFVYNTPLKNCPEKLKIYKTLERCCSDDSDTSHCSNSQIIGVGNSTIFFINSSFNRSNCKPPKSSRIVLLPFSDPETVPARALHEVGHMLGLWDQYCYWPNPKNPNPVDYVEGRCRPLKEGECHFDYCSREDKLVEDLEPHLCVGNLNQLGGIDVMGGFSDPSRNYVSHPKYGFTEEEYLYLNDILSCE